MKLILRSTGIGLLAGMRTFAPPAWLMQSQSLRVRNFWFFAAAFETVFDKTRFIGNRTSPPQLIGRVLSGLGTAVYINLLESNKKEINLISSGVTAALAATISTYTFFHLRKWASTRLKIVDGFVGVAEDAISLELGRFLAQEFRLDSIVPEK